MPSWDALLKEMQAQPPGKVAQWFSDKYEDLLGQVATLRGGRHVILYGSAFLEKPQAPANRISLTHDDLNALMTAIYGMEWQRGLTLILHTPGGVTNAAETIVSYLRSKFTEIEVIVPTLAMSAGTMVALGTDKVVMGRQSQLGPIDPQLQMGGRSVSARAVVEQFERAHDDIVKNAQTAHLWAPILASLGPSLLQEAQNALDYSEQMVANWLATWMLKGESDPKKAGKRVARHFNDASTHKSHGRRIDRDEARGQGVNVEDLEDSQDLQEAVLTAYHLMTLGFDHGPATKLIFTDHGQSFVKNWVSPEEAAQQQQAQQQGKPKQSGSSRQRRGGRRR